MDKSIGFGLYQSCGNMGCWMCVCVWFAVVWVGSGRGAWTRVWRGGVVLCMCELWVRILCVDGRSSYLYIVQGGYLRILGAPSVKSCCTLSISASYRVFVCGRYPKSLLCLCVVVGPHGRLAPKNGKSGPHCWEREVSPQFVHQLAKTAVTATPLVCCVVWSLKYRYAPRLQIIDD